MNAQTFLQYARIQNSVGLTDKTLDHGPDVSINVEQDMEKLWTWVPNP